MSVCVWALHVILMCKPDLFVYYLESAACKSMGMTISGAASLTKGTLSDELRQRQPQHLPQLGGKD